MYFGENILRDTIKIEHPYSAATTTTTTKKRSLLCVCDQEMPHSEQTHRLN